MKRKLIYFILALPLFMGGCGYSFGSLLPVHIDSIYVEIFENKTFEENIEIEITNAIKERFNWDASVKVVNTVEEADAMLTGEVIDYIREPARYSPGEDRNVDEYRLVLVVNLEFIDLVKEETVWTEGNFTGEAFYVVSGIIAETQSRVRSNSEEDALEFATRDLAQNIVDRTIEGW